MLSLAFTTLAQHGDALSQYYEYSNGGDYSNEGGGGGGAGGLALVAIALFGFGVILAAIMDARERWIRFRNRDGILSFEEYSNGDKDNPNFLALGLVVFLAIASCYYLDFGCCGCVLLFPLLCIGIAYILEVFTYSIWNSNWLRKNGMK